MNHKDLVEMAAAAMTMKSTEDAKNAEENDAEVKDDMFIISIPMISGRVFKVDARQIDWESLGTPESQANLEQNEGIIRGMVHHLVTADFTDPETDKMIMDFDESITNLFKNFGIDDPGYGEIQQKSMTKPYILLLGKCFDALTLINVIAHNVAMHGLATKIFGITDSFKDIADLNDITEMDNSTEGLITEDRHAFEGIEDPHDVSGLLGD